MNVITHALPHIWQEKPELEYIDLPPRQRCGLACMTMQLHYYGIPATPEEVLAVLRRFKSINQAGDWKHAGQVKVLKDYGLVAWRRNWHYVAEPNLSPQEYFRTREGYNEQQLNAFNWQTAAEAPYTQPLAQFLHSLQLSLLAGDPVIVSVKPDFSHNKANHQVVVSGWNEAELTYQVYDPIQSVGPATVHESYLSEYANLWAIFTQQA